jgi:urease accessory protein
MKLHYAVLPATLLLLPMVAMAHPQGHADSILSGFAHPWLGTDHLLAMLAVGMLAATQIQLRQQLICIELFLLCLATGVYISIPDQLLPTAEYLVSLSVGLLGASLWLAKKLSRWAISGIIIASGVLHGIVHGVEIPSNTQSSAFIIGMLSASIMLHLCGLLWLNWGKKRALPFFQSANGVGLAASSVLLMLSL